MRESPSNLLIANTSAIASIVKKIKNAVVSGKEEHTQNIASIHIISKCGVAVTGAPDSATIEVLPNIGRCDHTYAYYICNVLDSKVGKNYGITAEGSIVFFLKDDISEENFHQPGSQDSFGSMLGFAASSNGFACRVLPGKYPYDWGDGYEYTMSAYHNATVLSEFKLHGYTRNSKGYRSKAAVAFKSKHKNLRSFLARIGAKPMAGVVPACYGGAFAASVSNIRKTDAAVWKNLEKRLRRADNLEEGHFAERLWALLLTEDLPPLKANAISEYADDWCDDPGYTYGAFMKRVGKRKKKQLSTT